jgi:hypothetical protein
MTSFKAGIAENPAVRRRFVPHHPLYSVERGREPALPPLGGLAIALFAAYAWGLNQVANILLHS